MSIVELGYVKYYVDEQKKEAYVDGVSENMPHLWDVEIVDEILGIPVTKIRQGAFYKCNKIKDVDIPASVIEIRQKAFAHCKNLSKIHHAARNTVRIGANAFEHCDELQIIGSNATYELVGNGIFICCQSLCEVPALGGNLYSMTLDNTVKLHTITLASNTKVYRGGLTNSSIVAVKLSGDLSNDSDYEELKDKLIHIPAQSKLIELAYNGYLVKEI